MLAYLSVETHVMQKNPPPRYVLLDLIRVFAAGLVVWFHIALSTDLPGRTGPVIPGFYYFSLGNVAVTIFLILSGMVLELTYGQEKIEWWQFFSKRIKGIYKVYFPALVMVLLIFLAKNIFYNHTSLFYCSNCTLLNSACSVVGFCAFIGEWGGPFMRTAWFIGLIITLYAFFPFLSNILTQRPYLNLAALLAISIAGKVLIKDTGLLAGNAIEWFPLVRMFEFTLGMYLAQRVPHSVLTSLNSFKYSKAITFLSALSFPVFLIHYELEFVITILRNNNFSLFSSIIFYLVVTLLLSYIVLLLSLFKRKKYFSNAK